MSKNALLITGSPRRRKSTSYVLATELSARLEKRGWSCDVVFAVDTRPGDDAAANLVAGVNAADLVVVVCPLYVDQLPAGVVAALESISSARPSMTDKPRRLAGIVQCGFPESMQNDTALAVLRRFAELTGFEWAGGLSRGMGGAVSGRPLDKVGIGAKGISEALDLAATALSNGESIPERAVVLMARPPMPQWLYIAAANIGWYLIDFSRLIAAIRRKKN